MNSDNDSPDEGRREITKALAICILFDVIWAMATFSGHHRSPEARTIIAVGAMFPLLTVWSIVGLCCGWHDPPKDEPRAARLRREGWVGFTLTLVLLPSFIALDALCVILAVWLGAILFGGFIVVLLVQLCISWGKIKEAAALRSQAAQPTLLVVWPRYVESRSSVMVVNRVRSPGPPRRRRY